MKVKMVSVEYQRKKNLGDFNSAAVTCSLWADLDEGDDLDACMSGLWNMAKANVKAQLLPLVQSQQAQDERTYLGLPAELREVVDANTGTTD